MACWPAIGAPGAPGLLNGISVLLEFGVRAEPTHMTMTHPPLSTLAAVGAAHTAVERGERGLQRRLTFLRSPAAAHHVGRGLHEQVHHHVGLRRLVPLPGDHAAIALPRLERAPTTARRPG